MGFVFGGWGGGGEIRYPRQPGRKKDERYTGDRKR